MKEDCLSYGTSSVLENFFRIFVKKHDLQVSFFTMLLDYIFSLCGLQKTVER